MITRRRGRFGIKLTMALAVAAVGLGGCSSMKSGGVDPIEWYRDLSGNSANDAKDQTANAQNLKEGGKEPYPNLASVPTVPSTAISKADREKMVQSLIADRQNAQYTDQQLRAGQNMSAIPAPTPPSMIAAAPATSSFAQAGVATPTAASAKPGRMVAAPRAPVKAETLPLAGAEPAPATQKVASDTKKRADDTKKKRAANKRSTEAPPAESSLKSPSLGPMPTGEQAEAPPPVPPGVPHSVQRVVHPRSEELAEAGPARSDVAPASPRASGSDSGVTVQAAEINFTPGPFRARILPADQKQLTDVAQMVMHNNGRIRVVGHGGATAQGDLAQREFQSFNAALDNAKAVALALTKLGVPASRIDVETEANVNSPDRADIFVQY